MGSGAAAREWPAAREPHEPRLGGVGGSSGHAGRSSGCPEQGRSPPHEKATGRTDDPGPERAGRGAGGALRPIPQLPAGGGSRELRSRLRERVELSDVVQEVLVEIVRQFPSFTGENETAFLGWMRRLVAQKLADLGRFHKRLKRGGGVFPVSLDHDLDFGNSSHDARGGRGPAARHPVASPDEPERGGESARADGLLTGTLALLPASEAEVLWLHHAEGLSFSTISERLGLSRKRIRVIWARGLRSMRRSMGRQSI